MARTKKADTPILKRFNEKYTVKPNGCWEWNVNSSNLYPSFSINGRTRGAHVVSYILFIGEKKAGLYVCHTCDNKKCVNPFHLFLGTAKDNAADYYKKGLHKNRPSRVGTKGLHPSLYYYRNLGCRCDSCREINTTYIRERRRRLSKK